MMLVMSAQNECAEYQRLQRAYDDAIIVWEQDRHPNVRPINSEKLTNEQRPNFATERYPKGTSSPTNFVFI